MVARTSIAPFLAGAGWMSWGVAAALAATSLFCRWAVNAAAVGPYNMGPAVFFSFTGTIALIASVYAAPLLALAGLVSLFIQRWAALRFLAAGFTAALPLAILSWLGP